MAYENYYHSYLFYIIYGMETFSYKKYDLMVKNKIFDIQVV